MIKHINNYWLVVLILISNSCTQNYQEKDNSSNKYYQENKELKLKIDQLEDLHSSEQNAIFEYILYIDSIKTNVNELLKNRIILNSSEEGSVQNKKKDILNKLQIINSLVDADKKKITELERQLSKIRQRSNDKKLIKIIDNLKKERLKMFETISFLNSEIVVLKDKIVIKDDEIQGQHIIINNQKQKLEIQEKELNKRTVLLVGKSRFESIILEQKNYLYIKQRANRINILSEGKQMVKLQKMDHKVTKLIISDDYWINNKLLTVFIKGDF